MKKRLSLIVPVVIVGLTADCTDSPTVPEGLAASPQLSLAGGGSDVKEIRIRDKCEPESFNAAFGEGTCISDDNVTLAEFLDAVNPADGGHGAWRFNPDDTHIDEGESVLAINRGGEVHSFTEVVAFGGGIIPPLNDALPPGTPLAVPVDPAGVPATFLPAGGNLPVDGLSEGTHFFMCLIHPWMRTVVEVRD